MQRIHTDGHTICALVFPASKNGEPLTKELPVLTGAELIEAESINQPQFVDRMRALSPTLGIIGGYSEIFGANLINVPRHGTINLHGGALPKYRGGSPLNWQIINGESEIGLSVVQTDTGIDTGNIMASGSIPLQDHDTIGDIHEKANQLFPDLVSQVISDLETGIQESIPQDSEGAKYWHQRNDADGKIDWEHISVRETINLVRGITRPYPGAFCFSGQQEVRIFAAEMPDQVIRGVPGRVLWLQGMGPFVLCRDGAVLLTNYTINGNAAGALKNGAHLT